LSRALYRFAFAVLIRLCAGGRRRQLVGLEPWGGRSDVFQAGLCGAQEFGPAYLAGAFAFGDYAMTTNRMVTLPGGDSFTADFNAQSYGGRLEGGYHIALAPFRLTPYAALQVQNFQAPAYGESAANGARAFALNHDSQSATDMRFELAAWADKTFAMPDGNALNLFGRLAWAHDWQSNPSIAATFIGLPTASFIVGGARQAPDQALVAAGVEWRFAKNWTVTAKFDGQFGEGSQTYASTGRVDYRW
jgi:outer membrane autotransporter protein